MTKLLLSSLSERVAFCDPASGKKLQLKRVRARSAIVVLGQDMLGRIFVLHAWADRCSTDRLLEQIYWANETFLPRTFGIEANAMQVLFGDMVIREAKFRQRKVPVQEIYQDTKVEKNWRIRTALQPVIADGRLLVSRTHVELQGELKTFPMSLTKDLIDALASAVNMLRKPTPQRERQEENAAYFAYLRETGASPAYIAEKAREMLGVS